MVRPALVIARDNKKAQQEKEEQERRDRRHITINADPPHPTFNSGDQDMYRAASAPRHDALDSPDVTPDSPHVTEMEPRQDSQAQPEDHLPRPPLAAVVIREEADPIGRDENLRLDALGEEERPHSHTEVEKAPSASGDYREGSQSNKESGE